jgi:hypothetical protein
VGMTLLSVEDALCAAYPEHRFPNNAHMSIYLMYMDNGYPSKCEFSTHFNISSRRFVFEFNHFVQIIHVV